jgi:hypothetical protein
LYVTDFVCVPNSGKYLVLPPSLRSTAPEIEARVFPRSQRQQQPSGILRPSLSLFSLGEQHYVFMRELLLVMSGVEGNYIRVAAQSLDSDKHSTSLASLSQVRFTPLPLLRKLLHNYFMDCWNNC